METRLESIKSRCEENKLPTRILSPKPEGQETLFEDANRDGLIIQIPEERESKSIIIYNDEELELVEKSQFEKFRYIKGYEAIWSPELKLIECEVQASGIYRGSSMILNRLLRLFGQETDDKKKKVIKIPTPKEGIYITIGESSIEFNILANLRSEFLFSGRRLFGKPTITIEGITLNTHQEAKDNLQKIANAVLFQLDLLTNFPIHLSIDRDLLRELRMRQRTKKEELIISEPRYEYDSEAISIYWYARTAVDMPLLQFLAFYQVMEYYFPVYSYQETQQKIKSIIKNPIFNPDNDNDVVKILNVVKFSAKGKSVGDEKSQLRATINYCVDNSAMREFFDDNEERKDFFDVHKKSSSLAKQKISFSNPDNDMRSDVANRVYEIRCRIVHTKDEDNSSMLLPFSSEIKNLKYDLELVEFLARKVLIAGSRPLQI